MIPLPTAAPKKEEVGNGESERKSMPLTCTETNTASSGVRHLLRGMSDYFVKS